MIMEKRRYTLRKRAQQQGETRARIVAATMALHEEIGPRETTVSAIAERAGVQRLTVYRHFPNEDALFQACTSCWLEHHPPPQLAQLSVGTPSGERSCQALEALYHYYRGTRQMWQRSYRDLEQVPALQGPMQAFEAYLTAFGEILLEEWPAVLKQDSGLAATITLALRFSTWEMLDSQGLKDPAMAALVYRWLEAVACPPGGESSAGC
jgi:AcrR family transcriptional regulator